jgi:flagellar basal body rod protein FlgG
MSEIASQVGSAVNGLAREYNIIVHNLANVSTDGYKRRSNTFSKTLTELGAGSKARIGDEADLYSTFDFSQGNFIESGRSMDFALFGKGFFVIETPDGPLYTRNGAFRISENNQIVDQEGRTIAGKNGPIAVPLGTSGSEISVSSDGTISAKGLAIGQFQLVDFKEDEKELVSVGLNCYLPTRKIEPEDAENIVVKQGYKEGSNVQMVEELVDMIMVSRLYAANMKFMTAGKDNSKSLMGVAMG